MASNMDRSLDEILADRKKPGGRGGRGPRNSSNNATNNNGGSRRRDRRDGRDEYPRDGIRKSYRDEPRKIDEEWVHDRYDDNDNTERRSKPSRPSRASPEREGQNRGGGGGGGSRIRVENLHYDLTRDDLEGLFLRVGSVRSVELLYDRAGRSEGVAYVTYDSQEDARAAVREFDGANAKGQPIRLTIVSGRRNAFEGALKPGSGRPLAERITRPRNQNNGEDDDDEEDGKLSMAAAARRGIDRYIPGGGGDKDTRSRSPRHGRHEGGRRPGERRGGAGGGRGGPRDNNANSGGGDGNRSSNRRPRKTQEELDAEMADYFGGDDAGGQPAEAPAAAAPANNADEDEDMIL